MHITCRLLLTVFYTNGYKYLVLPPHSHDWSEMSHLRCMQLRQMSPDEWPTFSRMMVIAETVSESSKYRGTSVTLPCGLLSRFPSHPLHTLWPSTVVSIFICSSWDLDAFEKMSATIDRPSMLLSTYTVSTANTDSLTSSMCVCRFDLNYDVLNRFVFHESCALAPLMVSLSIPVS